MGRPAPLLLRGLRELRTPEARAHGILEYRRGQSLVRLAAYGLDDRAASLVDQPAILDELAAGIEAITIPLFPAAIAESMAERTGRSDRWYVLAARAAQRAEALAPPDGS